MPRKHRRAEPPEPPARSSSPRSAAPAWAQLLGYDVRVVESDKQYRCPGCDHLVRAGVSHLVVMPIGDADARRHWHTGCWRRELRRLGTHLDGHDG